MNRLADSASPYLLQHRDNPVEWWPWCPDAFAAAKSSGKPVLLSIGYAACHWCHVMAHESFEEAETASVMNALYINIKVDREERPDVDHVYMTALQALGEHGGWPMTMFLTPDGEPFWGGTYFPKEPRFGQPAFMTVLREVARVFNEERDRVGHNVAALRNALRHAPPETAAELGLRELDMIGEGLLRAFDPVAGGLNGAPKFPNPTMLELLWRHTARTGRKDSQEALLTTLRQMALGGIHDHLGGGFARYSVDAQWLVPHFEKMLYDNAQLLELYALAAQTSNEAVFREAAEGIVAWLSREMTDPGGAFYASLDADSEGEEGRFYVWDTAEIAAILGDEASDFNAAYGVVLEGNWGGRNILNRLHGANSTDTDSRWADAREKLLAAREERVRPGLDDKILADWNSLMITALVRAGLMLSQPGWIDMARRAFHFVAESMSDGDSLAHAARGSSRVTPCFAADLASMARAALVLWEASGECYYLEKTGRWMGLLDSQYRDASSGLLAMTRNDAVDLPIRPRPTHDDAVPNANGLYAECLARLALTTAAKADRTRAESFLTAASRAARAAPAAHSSIFNALDLYMRAATIGLSPGSSLDTAALAVPYPNRVVARAATAIGATGVPDGAALVCAGQRCSLPIYNDDDVAAEVARLTRMTAT